MGICRKHREGRLLDGRIVLLLFVVSATILFVGKKVELDGIARSIDHVDARINRLREERSQLMATIVFKQNPGAIEQIARGRLKMEYSLGRLSDLTFDVPQRSGHP